MSVGGDPVLDWLLEKSDPGVRYFALRDLCHASSDDADLLEARRVTVRTSPVKEILEAQGDDGAWAGSAPGYLPKYRGTLWQVIFLGQFAADGDHPPIRRAVDHVLQHGRSPQGGLSMNARASGLIHCLQGNLAASLLELGYGEDPRLKESLSWLARSITGDGIAPSENKGAEVRYLRSGNSGPGFLCSANNHLPCAWGAIPAMDALSRIPVEERSDEIQRAIEVGVEFLLSRDPASADYPMGWSKKPNRSWFKFGYPMGYITDVLRNVEVLARLGLGKDPRLDKAAELILSKPDDQGKWPLEYTYNGKTWCDVEIKGRPSKWVTLRARRALHGMGVEV
jgi:hypothetical protein